MPEETTTATIAPTTAPAAITGAALRTLPGVDPSTITSFIDALTDASERLSNIASHLDAARVHDEAFGKLIDAAKVRDAYHARLPATERNLAEARSVINRFLAEFNASATA